MEKKQHVLLQDRDLNDIEFTSVSLTTSAVKIIRLAAQAMLDFLPGVNFESMTREEILAMFSDRLQWDSDSGELLMWSEYPDKSYCVAIPREHWDVQAQGSFH